MRNDSKSNKVGQRPRKSASSSPSNFKKSAPGEKSYNFRDNPKTFNKFDKPAGADSRPAFKKHVSKFDPNDRYGSKKINSDQPQNSENQGFGFKPRGGRDFDSNAPRKFENDKPRFDQSNSRNFEGKPPRNFGSEKPRFEGDSKRGFNPEKREFSQNKFEKPNNRFSENKPLKRYKTEAENIEPTIERTPSKHENDKSRFSDTPGRARRPITEAKRPTFKRFEGPYQKNLNKDNGGGERQNKRDTYRTDGAPFDYESRLKETIEEKNGTIRLNRFIANSGICSRRDADELIEAGQITVNGEIVKEMGHQVKFTDVVKYGNKLLTREKMVYLLLNKPKDYITTTEDPLERKTVMKLIEGACKERIYPVGRLDRNTTGLLLFTNDGELASKLTHPSYNIEKMYQVELDKPITEEAYQAILKGITLEDGPIKADSFGIVTPDAMVVGIQIHSGRNHIVRRIFAHLGYEVVKLDRTVFAGLNKKDLPRGNYRMLTQKEVIKLKYLSN